MVAVAEITSLEKLRIAYKRKEAMAEDILQQMDAATTARWALEASIKLVPSLGRALATVRRIERGLKADYAWALEATHTAYGVFEAACRDEHVAPW